MSHMMIHRLYSIGNSPEINSTSRIQIVANTGKTQEEWRKIATESRWHVVEQIMGINMDFIF